MKRPDLFIDALSTLLFSWGADAPPEAIWAANEILDWIQEEYGVCITRFEEQVSDEEWEAIQTEIYDKLSTE